MEVLGLIPARGGSRGIPNKNLAPLGGRPLLAWACDAAGASKRLTRIAVSTESPEIAAAARALGVDVIDRPPEFATDEVPMLPVVRHAVDATDADALVLLQPTSPLRRATDIDAAFDLWRSSGADSVVSVVRVPHQFTPGSLLRSTPGGRIEPLDDAAPASRQEKPVLYARNGPAVLVVSAAVVRTGSLYGDDTRGYEMSALASIDVDGPDDLELAEALLRLRASAAEQTNG
jgi:CMP-N,N'-diacetyllegionaminic acid synthase